MVSWCYQNGIRVYLLALTDGSIGGLLTFYNKDSAFKLDIVEDIYNINMEYLGGHENGAIVIGCGLAKHHVLNVNLFNNGLEYCVLVNTASELDSGVSLRRSLQLGQSEARQDV